MIRGLQNFLRNGEKSRENSKTPLCPYKIQPENQGKFVWLTGVPSSGKSTTAQLMARKLDFVYYEGDCAMTFTNPFVPVEAENPAIALLRGFLVTKPVIEAGRRPDFA